ncbi:MAG: hypothetical protein HN534_01495 [Euryarchaeota archaeon]|jgi:uncharacterized membrane protein|nr:hypothetical protein [Euryarchaeota archaeon]MBT3653596.1 hypothetical protein [Euryarchaeota archaeon]MBT3757195.1 hypothetical protein [Euryarchaeota archaeon]MBT4050958.1 hypothetical protein [Euryarchaeota archaeon]MBT4649789.1 hypothetical protein [Euryarchaeota archaeon]|tara:strand:+ start:549 stop:1124 length:576 start_codon:yes stop_codon:yes gene_type:complete
MNTEFLSEPIFLVVLAGLLSSSFLSINAKKQSGSERSNALVISALAFSLTGILTSAITYAIYNSMISKGYSPLCSSNGFIGCADVIGDPSFNTLLTLPWGLIGISGFGLLLYLILSIRMDPHARWVSNHLDYSWYASIIGMVIVVFLVIVELAFVDGAPHICAYCTVAHLSMIGFLVSAHMLREHKASGDW